MKITKLKPREYPPDEHEDEEGLHIKTRKTLADEHENEEATIINSMGWWSGVWAGNMKVGTLQ